jgi:nucleoside-diphosphate-sugar epimerase
MDAILIGHMASRHGDAYSQPTIPFDVNVRGTANLFHAAVKNGIDRVCLLSSINAVDGTPETTFFSRDCPRIPHDLSDYYSLTKSLQEGIAEAFHYKQNINVSILRLGWVVDADTRVDKYGNPLLKNHYALVDPRDIGEVALRTLELSDLTYEILYVLGTPEADQHFDVAYTRERLNWIPAYPFEPIPNDTL